MTSANPVPISDIEQAQHENDANAKRSVLIGKTSGGGYVPFQVDANGKLILNLTENIPLTDLSDVTITAPADNELLAYDSTSGEWINQTAAQAGLSATGHTHTEADITDLTHYTTTDFNTDFATKTTADLTEGANLYYTDERVDDRVAALIQNGTGLTWSYNDVANTLTGNVGLSFSDLTVATGNVDMGGFEFRAKTFQSDVVTGTSPFIVASTTLVTNLNSDLLDGQEGNFYQAATNITGTVDISAQTNLAVTSPVTLTGDTLSLDFSTNNTWTGFNTFTKIPTGNAPTDSTLVINPASASANAAMLWVGVGSVEMATIDKEGDMGLAGNFLSLKQVRGASLYANNGITVDYFDSASNELYFEHGILTDFVPV